MTVIDESAAAAAAAATVGLVVAPVADNVCVVPVQAYASALKQTEAESLPAPPLSVGFTYELCAGIIDKSKSLQQIAAEEVWQALASTLGMTCLGLPTSILT